MQFFGTKENRYMIQDNVCQVKIGKQYLRLRTVKSSGFEYSGLVTDYSMKHRWHFLTVPFGGNEIKLKSDLNKSSKRFRIRAQHCIRRQREGCGRQAAGPRGPVVPTSFREIKKNGVCFHSDDFVYVTLATLTAPHRKLCRGKWTRTRPSGCGFSQPFLLIVFI